MSSRSHVPTGRFLHERLDVPPSGTDGQILVSARGLQQAYRTSRRKGDAAPVLRGVDVDVRAGELLAIVGPSGQGKSTLLHCLSGLLPIDAGRLQLVGADLSRASRSERAVARRTHTGFVFQEFNLVDALTVAQNVELALRSTGRRPRVNQVLPTLERVGMADKASSYPSQLSGGQQQRVAVARVLACEPEVVFADEPTGALDARNGGVVMSGLHRLAARGSAVVVVTHDADVAAAADRVVTLEDGVII